MKGWSLYGLRIQYMKPVKHIDMNEKTFPIFFTSLHPLLIESFDCYPTYIKAISNHLCVCINVSYFILNKNCFLVLPSTIIEFQQHFH